MILSLGTQTPERVYICICGRTKMQTIVRGKVHILMKANEGLSCSGKQTDIAAKLSMFCALNTPFHIINFLACENPSQDTDINCTSNSVHICTAGCQPLLRALRFAQHNMFQQAACMFSLLFTLWPEPHSICPPLSRYSKHCLSDVHVHRAAQQLAQKWP
jgi:hypothetical protein